MRSQRRTTGDANGIHGARGQTAPPSTAVAPEVEALRAAARALSEVCAHLRQLARVRVDQLRLDVRTRIRRGLLLAAGAALSFVVALIGIGYLVHGVALGLAAACGGRIWLGYMLAGLLFVGAAVVSVLAIDASRRAASLARVQRKYAGADAGETGENQDVSRDPSRSAAA